MTTSLRSLPSLPGDSVRRLVVFEICFPLAIESTHFFGHDERNPWECEGMEHL